MDEEHVRADSLIEEALKEMEGMTTEEKIEEFRNYLPCSGAESYIYDYFNTLFPPPEPRKCYVFFYEYLLNDTWYPTWDTRRNRKRIEEDHARFSASENHRNVSRIIEVSE